MNTDIRSEFEQYIKDLTITICKEIMLERLDEICNKYQKQYTEYKMTSDIIYTVGKEFKTQTQESKKIVHNIDQNTKEILNDIGNNITRLEEDSTKIFANYSKEVQLLNTDERKKFINELNFCIGKSIEELRIVIFDGCEDISDKLTGIITPEILNDFINRLNESSKNIQDAVSFINSTYQSKVEANLNNIISYSKEKQNLLNEAVDEHVNKLINELSNARELNNKIIKTYFKEFKTMGIEQMEVFSKSLAKILRDEKVTAENLIGKQKEFVNRLELETQKFDAIYKHIYNYEITLNEIKENQTLTLNKITKQINFLLLEWDKKKKDDLTEKIEQDKKEASIAWKMYMSITNTMMIALFLIVIIMEKPWESFGITNSYILLLAFIVVLLIIIFRKNIVTLILKKLNKS